LELPELQLMAGFTRVGAEAAEAVGFGRESFLSAYARSASRQTEEVLENDCLAVALRQFMRPRGEYDGAAGELYGELRKLVPDEKGNGFPRSAGAFGKKLRILMPSLKEVGLVVKPYDGD